MPKSRPEIWAMLSIPMLPESETISPKTTVKIAHRIMLLRISSESVVCSRCAATIDMPMNAISAPDAPPTIPLLPIRFEHAIDREPRKTNAANVCAEP